MELLGSPFFLNEPESITYEQLRKQKEDLAKQLYEMMVIDGDI
jgi:hypothetical protein